MKRVACVLLSHAILWAATAAAAGEAWTWTKLADAPRDVAGRECPPGMDGAWCYVPEWKGFLLYGEVPIEAVGQAVFGAARRLRAGEKRLALHPNCGTNLVTAATLATLATALALGGAQGTRRRIERLPLAVLASLAALLLARPAGELAQRYLTTQAEIGSLQVTSIERLTRPGPAVHRVRTTG